MCLTPDKTFHKRESIPTSTLYGDFKTSRGARVLTSPILVVKGLRAMSGGRVYSPIQNYEYHYGNEVSASMDTRIPHDHTIHEGLHAFQKVRDLQNYFYITSDMDLGYDYRGSNFGFRNGNVYAFPAVIPAGASLWVGEDGDVCATSLTVYRDLKSVADAFGGLSPATTLNKVLK